VIAAVAGIAAIIFLFFVPRGSPKPSLAPQYRQITFSGTADYPAVSPDGKFLAFAEPADAANRIMVQDLAGGAPLEVFRGQRCVSLRWLPDGTELSMIARDGSNQTGILLIPRLGGTPRTVESSSGLTNVAWSPDGSHYARPEGTSISIVNRASGAAKALLIKGPVLQVLDLDWAPGGDRLAFTAINDKRESVLGTIRTDGSQQQDLVAGTSRIESPRWSSRGDAVYFLQGTEQSMDLWKITVSPRTGGPSGPASIILPELQTRFSFSVASDGKKLSYSRLLVTRHLWLAESAASGQGRAVTASALTTGTSVNHFPSISPDGKQVAFVMATGKTSQVFVVPLDGGSAQQITFMNSVNYGPSWSPDGREIAFISMEGGIARVWKAGSKGESPVPLRAGEVGGYSLSWGPGDRILYQTLGNRNIGMIDPVSGRVDSLIKESEGGWLFNPRYSPDGNEIAVFWNRGSSRGIWVLSPKTGERRSLYPGNYLPVGWTLDGRGVYAAIQRGLTLEIIAIDAEKGNSRTVLVTTIDQEKGAPSHFYVGMTPDGKRFIFQVGKSQSDIWLVENFDPGVK